MTANFFFFSLLVKLSGSYPDSSSVTILNMGVFNEKFYQIGTIKKSTTIRPIKEDKNIPDELLYFSFQPTEVTLIEVQECEERLKKDWILYKNRMTSNALVPNYADLFAYWQTNNKFCAGIINKTMPKLFFNFINSKAGESFLKTIKVEKLYYKVVKSETNENFESMYQEDNGYEKIIISADEKSQSYQLKKPLAFKDKSTLVLDFGSSHYSGLTPGTLTKKTTYVLKVTFIFENKNQEINVVASPFMINI